MSESAQAGRARRVFCISMQRTGTTSVGKFFRDFGFRWCGWPSDERNNWSGAWYDGDFERIFSSAEFRAADAFEDSPWFMPDFYKVLLHRFPEARFVLFTRDAASWFRSMVHHSGGDIIGGGRIHCRIYRRELEYFELLRSGRIDEVSENDIYAPKVMKMTGRAKHYMDVYTLHNLEVQAFFRRRAPASLHVGTLEDPRKWQRLGEFLGVHVPEGYVSHENASPARHGQAVLDAVRPDLPAQGDASQP